jgi:hypothetical protein
MRCQFPYTLMMLYTSLNCDAIRHAAQSSVYLGPTWQTEADPNKD